MGVFIKKGETAPAVGLHGAAVGCCKVTHPGENATPDANPQEDTKQDENKQQDHKQEDNKQQEGGHPDVVVGGEGDKNKPTVIERPEYAPALNVEETHKYAYLVWLSNTPEEDTENFDADDYFVACRVLLWQLLHDPKTKASKDIDVIVMAGPQVGEAHAERLRKDGAIVRPVTVPNGKDDSWIIPKESRWGDIMGKLRAWEFEEYSRILMLDGDMILQSPLDSIFEDPGAVLMHTKSTGVKNDEPDLPEDYLLCSFMEISGTSHDWPPSDRGRFPGYFNGGFFMLKPSKKIFNYFVGLLDIPHRFNPEFMEQNLLNYAHRWDGPMPWKEINGKWNSKFTSEKDLEGGVVSMHEKWWKLRSGGKKLMQFVDSKRWQAEGYWQAQREMEKVGSNDQS
ncbi:hypothetical protein NLU13_6452 [Sarocladium strictum]|uniref:Hexosyltransferase n=1 Tax=Sarocladium strictum TaxID=5046 RepID=A0AA39GFW9_SARSR|nr:hypothetical protein NLU13_6452 [Sarocladium strictum]